MSGGVTRSLLVLGGSRSGKSRYAEEQAAGEKIYIATAEIFDEEMRQRVALHKQRREEQWQTLETPLELVAMLRSCDGAGRSILVDCLTLWISNLMYAGRDVDGEIDKLCRLIPQLEAKLILVSSEVGQGIVPENALARRFRDEQGLANQRVAAVVNEVVLVVAGLPLVVKPAARTSVQG